MLHFLVVSSSSLLYKFTYLSSLPHVTASFSDSLVQHLLSRLLKFASALVHELLLLLLLSQGSDCTPILAWLANAGTVIRNTALHVVGL